MLLFAWGFTKLPRIHFSQDLLHSLEANDKVLVDVQNQGQELIDKVREEDREAIEDQLERLSERWRLVQGQLEGRHDSLDCDVLVVDQCRELIERTDCERQAIDALLLSANAGAVDVETLDDRCKVPAHAQT